MGTCNRINKDPLITPAKLQIVIRGKHITRNIKHKIRSNYMDKELQNQTIRNNNWTIDTFHQVNWKSHGIAHNKHTNKRFNKKFCHGILPTAYIKQQHKETCLNTCPSCNEAIETNEHLFFCNHIKRKTWRTQFLIKLAKKLEKMNTEYTLLNILVKGIETYLLQEEPHYEQYTDKYTRLIIIQNNMGWNNLLKGRFSLEWSKIQIEHKKTLSHLEGKSTRWMEKVIAFLWTKINDL